MSIAKRASEAAEQATRHAYYVRNRERLLRESRQWKLEHRAQVKKYQKRYKRQVDSGARVPQMRGRAGMGYVFLGAKPTQGQAQHTQDAPMRKERVAI